MENIAGTEVVLLAGSNMAETMPPIIQYFEAQRSNRGILVVSDPRRTATASAADLHLRITPGTYATLANGLLHLLIRDDLIGHGYIRERTEGFERVLRLPPPIGRNVWSASHASPKPNCCRRRACSGGPVWR